MSSLLQRTSSSHSSDREAQDLAVAVAAAFLLTDDEVTQLSAAILAARLASWKATYARDATTAGAAQPAEQDGGASPSAARERQQRREAEDAAASIAATYARDLASQAAQFTQDWLKQHDGSLDGAEDALRGHLAAYSETRADWKAEQVAAHETGVGGNDGTQAAIEDLHNGYLLDENGDPITFDNAIYVLIMPEDSSSDFCADYAGNVYTMDDAPSLDFPAHVGCQHYCVLITAADVLNDDASVQ